MTIVPSATDLVNDASAVTLPRYAQIIGYTECAFFGVTRVDDPLHSNKPLWTKPERDQVAHFLAEAQAELEDVIGYPLAPRWIADEQQPYTFPLQARWTQVLEAGVEAQDDVGLAEAVDHTDDPAVVGPVATTVTNTDEIHVYHPGTAIEIHPSSITISGGNVTIEIPRCRMVKAADACDTAGLDYDDTSATGPFLQTVDVKRIYNDPSTHATLVWPHCCSASCSTAGCTEYTRDGCIYVKNGRLGVLDVLPASYSDGEWTRCTLDCCGSPAFAKLNYRAGVTLTRQAEDAIVRLAHAKMPHSPCNCDPQLWLWARDMTIPEVVSRERLNCPFGLAEGAWIAWRFAQSMKIHRAGVL